MFELDDFFVNDYYLLCDLWFICYFGKKCLGYIDKGKILLVNYAGKR